MSGLSRAIASPLTWPVEKSKLLYQGGNRTVIKSLVSLPTRHHGLGMMSSASQRGGSAFIMFQLQAFVYRATEGRTSSRVTDQAIAGFLSGMLSAPFHTYWELIKIRGKAPCIGSCWTSLKPMALRNAVFDGTFFGMNTLLEDRHAGVRFGIAAATASLANLVFDVWKTLQMKHYPTRVYLRGVIVDMRWNSFLMNYLVKGTDLCVNWFAVGCIKDTFFSEAKDL